MAGAPPITSFDTAPDQVAQQKASLLQAIAQAGTAGREAYAAQQAALQTDRLRVLQSALGPAGSQLDGILAARAGNADQFQGDFAAYGQAMGDANANYMDRAAAAIPAMRERTQQGVNAIKGQQDMQDRQNALELQLGQLRLQAAQADAARAQSGGAGPGEVTDRERFEYQKSRDAKSDEAQSVAERKYEAQLAQEAETAHRQDVDARAKQHASPGTYLEFQKAAQLDNAAAAEAYIAKLDAGYLQRSKISREALLRWVRDFYGAGAPTAGGGGGSIRMV